MKTTYWIFRILGILMGISSALDIIEFLRGAELNPSFSITLIAGMIFILASIYFGKKLNKKSEIAENITVE
jgi:hypothetical protein